MGLESGFSGEHIQKLHSVDLNKVCVLLQNISHPKGYYFVDKDQTAC